MIDIQSRLKEDHQRLDHLWNAFTAVAGLADKAAKRQSLADFESALVAHFEGEEKYLFPLLNLSFPEEVIALREEHEMIRQQIASLVDAEDIHAPEAGKADRFMRTLRRHAHREDEMLYQVANATEHSERYKNLLEFLERTFTQLRTDDAEE